MSQQPIKPTVYIETTIVGHLVSRLPSDPIVVGQMLETRKWWAQAAKDFERFTSELVRAEVSRGDPQAAQERLHAIAAVALVPITADAQVLADALVARHALPTKARVDALHLAISATNGIRYLLTWNCRHLANAMLRPIIEQVCRQHACEPPLICTPAELRKVSP